jgi:histidinol dehydrogenase
MSEAVPSDASGNGGRPASDSLELAARCVLSGLDAAAEAKLFNRGRAHDPDVERSVRAMISDVRDRGDAALRDAIHRFDGVTIESLEIPRGTWRLALRDVDEPTRTALQRAADAIAEFHRAQLPERLEVEVRPGVRLGRRADPLARVGVYAPGGRAAYPSSVLMGVVPARVAGVGEVVVCSPPGPDGLPPPAVLAACEVAGANRLFAIGGAAAVAALAHGTETVPRVDKVVGPGNAYVTEAKRQLTGVVAIDCPAGPSEVLIVADASAEAELIAIEMLAQAEHDPDAAAVLVTTDIRHLESVPRILARNIGDLARAEIIASSLAARGAILAAGTLEEALEFATRYAPEHLLLMIEDPRAALPRVRCAGTVFLGASSSVAFGDYATGANHVLPTAGLARSYSGLSTLDFLRWTTYQEVSPDAAREIAVTTALLASAEGLQAHALAAMVRMDPRRAEAGSGPTTTPAHGAGALVRAPVRFRPAYRDIEPYEPGRLPTPIDLSDNTNLFGVPPSAAAVLAALPEPVVTRYPSVQASELRRALAGLHGVAPENITTGCGSDDVIDSAIRAFLEPGGSVAYPWPTFGVVPLFARMNAADPVAIPLGPDFTLDADALLAARAGVTYLCRPNNPTGTLFERERVARVVQDAAGVVLIDEAYADFAEDHVLDLAIDADRAVVLRTLSKAYGLAGLRVGYAVGPATLIAEIEKSRGPYKVTGPGEAAAVAAIEGDGDWVRDRIRRVRENRERLAERLKTLGLRSWPSAANFLLVQVPAAAGGAPELGAALRASGVAVRTFPGLPTAGDCLRVTIGPWPMLEAFLSALEGALAGTPGRRRQREV